MRPKGPAAAPSSQRGAHSAPVMARLRDAWLDRVLSPQTLATTAIVLAPSLVASAPFTTKLIQLGVLLVLAAAANVHLRVGRTVIFFGAVVAFNVLSPAGRVLLTVLRVPVTDGALALGVAKASGLASLLLLSKIAIRPNLQLPGRFGRLVARMLRYLRALLALDLSVLARRPLTGLDTALLDLQNTADPPGPAARSGDTIPRSHSELSAVLVVTVIVVLSWLLVLLA